MSIILDLDNCIANDGWRIPHIHWDTQDPVKRYHDYHSLAPWDNVGNEDLWTDQPHAIIILTSRPETWRVQTEEWLRRNEIKHEVLLMRAENEYDPSWVVKQNQVLDLMMLGYKIPQDIIAAFDDRPEVVAMYKSIGIPAEVRSLHNVSAYRNAKGISI